MGNNLFRSIPSFLSNSGPATDAIAPVSGYAGKLQWECLAGTPVSDTSHISASSDGSGVGAAGLNTAASGSHDTWATSLLVDDWQTALK